MSSLNGDPRSGAHHGARHPPLSPWSAFAGLVADLPGGSFAFVMATGIVAIALRRLGFVRVAEPLFALDLAAYPILWILTLCRLALQPRAVLAELRQHRTAAGFLTMVAGTNVFGSEIALFTSDRHLAAALWLAAGVLWVGLGYAFFAQLTTRPAKPPLGDGLNGSWLLIVVATESLSILGSHVASLFAQPPIVAYLCLCWFLLGGVFYLVIIFLILERWLFGPMRRADFTPSYWINMGAVAIAAVAGARLEAMAGADPFLARLNPVIATATVLCWSLATWWIPLLAALTIWRHGRGGIRPAYSFEYWSMVFPLGMYTAATWAVAHADGLAFLDVVAQAFIWIAVAAWLATFIGMVRHLGRRLRDAFAGAA